MIYFIPAWTKEEDMMGMDDMSNHIKMIMHTEVKYEVVIFDYMPNLRYFLHSRDILESNYTNLFDLLQGYKSQLQTIITLEDLKFPSDCNYIYTPFNILVYQEDTLKAKVTLGKASQIYRVEYMENGISDNIVQADIYDDRGFLSSTAYYHRGKHSHTEYFDTTGQWIIREDVKTGIVLVNLNNNHGLKYRSYKNIKDLELELFNLYYRINKDDTFLASVSDENIEWLCDIEYISRFTLSFFQNRFNFNNLELLQMLLRESHATIVDSSTLHKNLLKNFHELSYKIHHISPYDSRFDLSITQELKEEIIYVEARFIGDNQEQRELILALLTYLSHVYDNFDQERQIKIVLRTNYIKHFKNILYKLLEDYFPDVLSEISLLPEEIVEAFYSDGARNDGAAIDKDIENYDLSPKIVKILTLKNCFEFISLSSEEQLFEIISRTRIIVDFSSSPDLFTQIAAISSGIPQINNVITDYCKHMQTGYVTSHISDLPQVLAYYLDSMKNWARARTHAILEINNYSGYALREKLLNILGENEESYD